MFFFDSCGPSSEKAEMTEENQEKRLNRGRFYKAEQEASFVESHVVSTPQTRDPAYKLAFRDTDFLLRQELRPVRFQLELLKCEMLLEEAGIGSTLVCYGSARIPSPEMAEAALAVPADLVAETGDLAKLLEDPRIAALLVGPGLGRGEAARR